MRLGRFVCYAGKDIGGGCDIPCEECSHYGVERRLGARRAKNVCLKLWERRDGFDRRRKHLRHKGFYAKVFGRGASHLKDNISALILLLVIFNLFNIADFLFTLKALAAGHAEGNPIMDKLFTVGPAAAGLFKITIGLIVTLFVWALRRYRLVLEASILIILMYMALIAYHMYGALMFY